MTNVATAIGVDQDENLVTSDEDSEFVPTPPRDPVLTLDKTADLNDTNGNGVADLGESIDYTFAVENTGNVTLTGVTVVDDRVSGLSASVTLAPGETHVFTADAYVVVQADLNIGVVHNTAVANGTSPLGPVESNTDSAEVPTPVPDPRPDVGEVGRDHYRRQRQRVRGCRRHRHLHLRRDQYGHGRPERGDHRRSEGRRDDTRLSRHRREHERDLYRDLPGHPGRRRRRGTAQHGHRIRGLHSARR